MNARLMSSTGSAAAAAHSAIGNVATGSAFAILQSAGAGGAGIAAVNTVVQAAWRWDGTAVGCLGLGYEQGRVIDAGPGETLGTVASR